MRSMQTYLFDSKGKCWTEAKTCGEGLFTDRLNLVTFNIWFDSFKWRERLDALLDIVQACKPHLIALQEVTPHQLNHILTMEWVRRDFFVSDITGATLEPHGVLLLSQIPMHDLMLLELPSDKDRKLLQATLDMGKRSIDVGAIHLESSVNATLKRLTQLDTVLPGLQQTSHSLLMGDFNFDPSQELEQSKIEQDFQDLWVLLRGDEPGYTEDTQMNPMRLLHKNKEKQVRFDRILLRSATPGWRPESVRLIGTDPIMSNDIEVFPSDHFGLTGTLVWSETEYNKK